LTPPDASQKAELPALRAAWETLGKVVAGLSTAEDQAAFLERCLDDLLRLFGADRALVLLHYEDGSASCPCSRTRGRALEGAEREAISRSVTRRALETGAIVVSRPIDDADASESLVWKGIFLAMAAPMRTIQWSKGHDPREPAGVLYVDFRDRRRIATETDRELLQATAHVIGAALTPYRKLDRARIELSEVAARTIAADPTLEELLRYDSMKELRRELASAIEGDAAILILGESGTGKTQLARAIAAASGRTPVVRAVLGSSDDLNTITSELFGHERGSFSGALSKRVGLVELADGGTLIFDEILNLPPPAQQLLLDFTQFGSYRPLGHDRREPKRARVRLIAATNGDLAAAIRERRFREDLYYRLAAVVLEVPPLRARRAEIPDLAAGILARHRLSTGGVPELTRAARELLLRPGWSLPGNVRQLEAATKRARDRALAEGQRDRIDAHHFSERDLGAAPGAEAAAPTARAPDSLAALDEERRALDERERALVEATLARHGGVVAHAAKDLGVARTTLSSRLDRLKISRR